MRVVFLVLDGLPVRHLGASVTPCLWALVGEGGGAGSGRSVLTSATYPNHATFITGTGPEDHGLPANWLVTADGPKPAHVVGPSTPTLFDVVGASAAVLGDQHLVGVMAAHRAASHWPPGGKLTDGVARDGHGYVAGREIVPRLQEALADGFDLVVGQLNEPDTAGHDHGPDSDEALTTYRQTDAHARSILEAARSRWAETVAIVVSDHDMAAVDHRPGIDLYSTAPDGLVPIPEGSGAVVWGYDPTAGAWLDDVEGVLGHEDQVPGRRLVWADAGRWFALPPGLGEIVYRGHHGGVHTRSQLAMVAGGHPAVAGLAQRLAQGPVEAVDWAPTIAALLGVSVPSATGTALLPPHR